MAVVIRLSRRGNKHKPFYRIVVAKSTSPVKGKCIENVGTYNSIQNKDGFKELRIVEDRIKYWLAVGAKLSSTVHKLLSNAGILHEKDMYMEPSFQNYSERMRKDKNTEKMFLERCHKGMNSGDVGCIKPFELKDF